MFVAWMTTVHVLIPLVFNRVISPLLEVLYEQLEPLALERLTLEQLTMLNFLHSNPPKL